MAGSVPHHDLYCFDDEGIFKGEEGTPNIFNMLLNSCDADMNSPVSVASFPDQPPLPLPLVMNMNSSDDTDSMMLVPQIEMGLYHFSGSDDYSQLISYHQDQPNFWQPNNLIPSQNWAILDGGEAVAEVEENPQKVQGRRYSVEERKARILRYLNKRNRRNFNKRIKYACRKTLADKRVRVRGRFAKNIDEPSPDQDQEQDHDFFINELEDHQHTHYTCNNNDISFHHHREMMMKYEEDYWLQAAMGDFNTCLI